MFLRPVRGERGIARKGFLVESRQQNVEGLALQDVEQRRWNLLLPEAHYLPRDSRSTPVLCCKSRVAFS